MREILFRGKCVDSGEWVYGVPIKKALVGSHDGYYPKIIPECDGRHQTVYSTAIKEETLGQYTGLKDVHGKRVFEADILSIKCADEKSRPYPVYFGTYNVDGFGNDFHIGFYTKHFGEDISLGFLADSNGSTDFEVIGNIFDSPELLEGEQ